MNKDEVIESEILLIMVLFGVFVFVFKMFAIPLILFCLYRTRCDMREFIICCFYLIVILAVFLYVLWGAWNLGVIFLEWILL